MSPTPAHPYRPDTGGADSWVSFNAAGAPCVVSGNPRAYETDVTRPDGYGAVVCNGCPVQAECLAEAMRHEGTVSAKGRHGVWGGLTPAERYALYRRKNRQRAKK